MVELLGELVGMESPSADLPSLDRLADRLAEVVAAHLGSPPERLTSGGRPHLRWSAGADCRVLVLGHFDTVWPLGTIERWPFLLAGDRATGPGAFDMKAGIVQGLAALSTLDDLDGITVLLTSDEEVGSPTSRALIEKAATGAGAALVLEPSAAGALKTERKGTSNYELHVEGRAAHAGLEPERGVNALLELAGQVLALHELADPSAGTTVTPTVASAGTTTNSVPARACAAVDVRTTTVAEQERVDTAMRSLRAGLDGARVSVTGGPNRPPLQRSASSELFGRAVRRAEALGLGTLDGVAVGGGSDGNFTAALGTPTLDGLGADGDGAHAEGEHVVVSAMAERAALFAALVEELKTA
ncbi:MAG: M20 family metallopeptidase [Acidimicrobiia bacterium]|nr:M20 family metallopeptidase [Acidimicrobiia bacterium]